MIYRNCCKKTICVTTKCNNKPVLFLSWPSYVNIEINSTYFFPVFFSDNYRVKWIVIDVLVMFDWQRIFLFSLLLQSAKERARYFKKQNERRRRSKLLFTNEKCLLCVVSIIKSKFTKVRHFMSISFSRKF
jgi:hypothetical protein